MTSWITALVTVVFHSKENKNRKESGSIDQLCVWFGNSVSWTHRCFWCLRFYCQITHRYPLILRKTASCIKPQSCGFIVVASCNLLNLLWAGNWLTQIHQRPDGQRIQTAPKGPGGKATHHTPPCLIILYFAWVSLSQCVPIEVKGFMPCNQSPIQELLIVLVTHYLVS